MRHHQLETGPREYPYSYSSQTLTAFSKGLNCSKDGLLFSALLLHEKLTTVLFPPVVEEEEERSSAEFEETMNGTTVSSIIFRSWRKRIRREWGLKIQNVNYEFIKHIRKIRFGYVPYLDG